VNRISRRVSCHHSQQPQPSQYYSKSIKHVILLADGGANSMCIWPAKRPKKKESLILL
jgi:hypothetical protein